MSAIFSQACYKFLFYKVTSTGAIFRQTERKLYLSKSCNREVVDVARLQHEFITGRA